MKMFILGMVTMWVVLSLVFFLLDAFRKIDLFDDDRMVLSCLFAPLLLFKLLPLLESTLMIFKFLDLMIKYKINPYHTKVSVIKGFSEEDKIKFVKRLKGEKQKRWASILQIEL